MIQKNEAPLSYQFRHCFTNGDKNLLTYWNPVSKLKIRITLQDGRVEIVKLSNALKKIEEMRCFPNKKPNTILPKGWKPNQRTKNKCLKFLLVLFNSNDHKWHGIRWEIVA